MPIPKNRHTLGLIGLYRCGNLGDEAIWQAFSKTLAPMLPDDWDLRMITFGPGGFESAVIPKDQQAASRLLHEMAMDDLGARKINTGFWAGRGFIRFLRVLSRMDSVWYAGGHWIHDLSLTTLAAVMTPIFWAKLRGAKGGFVNVGAGPLTSSIGKLITRAALGTREPLVVRDHHSAKQLSQAGVDRKVTVAKDAAFLLDSAHANIVKQLWSEMGWPKDRPVIGIVPCAWFKMSDLYKPSQHKVDRMISSLANQATRLAKKGYAVALFPTMLPEDEITCKKILEKTGDGPFYIAPTRKISAEKLMGIIGKLRALISFRMHPALFAYRTKVPIVACDYAPKISSFMADVGLEKWLVSLDDNWQDNLEKRVDELLEDPLPNRDALPLEKMRESAFSGIKEAFDTLEI